jgi:hypothetical protein
MRSLSLFAILVAGCTSQPLAGGDGGLPNDNDGAVAADLAGASCGMLSVSITAWLNSHQGCTTDIDCTYLGATGCGLPDQCGGYINTSGPGAYFQSLLSAWQSNSCGVGECAPCPNNQPGPPGCNMGVCGPRAPGTGGVGDACNSGNQCATGMCLNDIQSKLFFGGYCTIFDCNANGAVCPDGSACKDGGDGHQYCLKNCNPQLDIMQCRQGYSCCSGPGPSGTMGWCAPSQSSLCLSM